MRFTPSETSLDSPELSHRPATWDMLRKLTGVVQPETRLQGFRLHLGDGSRWWIAGCTPVSDWAEKFAAIMRLQPGKPEGSSLMILYRNAGHREQEATPAEGSQSWKRINGSFLKAWYRPGSPDVLCEFDTTGAEDIPHGVLWNYISFIYRESIRRGGLPFHAALVERQGQGIILAGPGGTGKSTCARRLPAPWQAWCDDEALLALSPDSRYVAHPFPTWSNYLWKSGETTCQVEAHLPLAGIFFLQQSPSDEVVPLGPAEAAVAAIDSAQQVLTRFLYWSDPGDARTLRASMFSNACQLAKKIPVFRLKLTHDGCFWEKVETALGWR